jgi:photosystem II stability/assembly factor-like uncharacterized protein
MDARQNPQHYRTSRAEQPHPRPHHRRLFVLLALTALAVILTTAAAATAGAAAWNRITPGFDEYYLGIDFVDGSNGWLVGDEQIILRTFDGGAHWTQQHRAPGAYALHKIQMYSATRGWAVGNGGALFATTDGSNWVQQPEPSGSYLGPMEDLCFIDSMEGWAVGSSSHIIHTTTAGADPDGSGPLEGWAMANTGVPQGTDSVWFNGVDFVNYQNGWAVGYNYETGGTYWASVYGTTNGGVTWSLLMPDRTSISGQLNDVEFFPPSGLWVCGEDTTKPYGERGMIYYTNTPSSPVWIRQTLPAGTDTLYSIHFVTASLGWAVGDDVILVTLNGGGLWTKESSSTTYNGILTDVDSVDGVTAWASGYGDRVMKRGAAVAPPKPVARSPKGVIGTRRPTFKWARAGAGVKYEVRVYKGSRKLVGKTRITATSWRCGKPLPKGSWLTWKVRSSNAAGTSGWSSLRFKVR